MRFPKATPRLQPAYHLLKRVFRYADGAHAVVNAAGSQTPLRNLETTSLAEEKVLDRNPHLFKNDFSMPVRRVIKAKDG